MEPATLILALDPNDTGIPEWHRAVLASAEKQPGYQASEVFEPKPGTDDRWVLFLRFDEDVQLRAWIDANAALMAREMTHLVVGQKGVLRGPVSLVVETRVSSDQAASFRAWQAEMDAAEKRFPGFLDSQLLEPIPGLAEGWTIVVRFDTVEHMDAWIKSDERRQLMERVNPEMHGKLQRVVSSFDGWFPLTVPAGTPPPPDWKQALTVLTAIYPLVMLLTLYLGPHLKALGLSFATQIFVSNILSTALLSWVVMPPLNRLLKPWLFSSRIDLAGTLGLLAFCALAVLIFNWIGM